MSRCRCKGLGSGVSPLRVSSCPHFMLSWLLSNVCFSRSTLISFVITSEPPKYSWSSVGIELWENGHFLQHLSLPVQNKEYLRLYLSELTSFYQLLALGWQATHRGPAICEVSLRPLPLSRLVCPRADHAQGGSLSTQLTQVHCHGRCLLEKPAPSGWL